MVASMLHERHHKWYSPTLGKDFEMLSYGERGYPVVVFPTTMGRFYEPKDFLLVDSAKWFVEQGLCQIYLVDSINEMSWYGKHLHPAQRVRNHQVYDRFIKNELVENIRHNTGVGKVAVAGPSFGGYHAANFAFRYPWLVSHLFSMSGAYDIKSFLDGYYDNEVYFNNPMDYLPNADHPDLWKMQIVLGTSEWDICLDSNLQLSGILKQKGIDHWLDIRGQQKHDWPLWREMFPHYLSLIHK